MQAAPLDVRRKALGILRDGRLRILTLVTNAAGVLTVVDGLVYGHRGEHVIAFTRLQDGPGIWRCSCKDTPPCPHLFAAEMVCHGVMPHGTDKAPKARPVKA